MIEHIADDLEVYSVDSDDYNKERIELKLNIRIIFFLKEHFKNASFDGSLLINTYVGSWLEWVLIGLDPDWVWCSLGWLLIGLTAD